MVLEENMASEHRVTGESTVAAFKRAGEMLFQVNYSYNFITFHRIIFYKQSSTMYTMYVQ